MNWARPISFYYCTQVRGALPPPGQVLYHARSFSRLKLLQQRDRVSTWHVRKKPDNKHTRTDNGANVFFFFGVFTWKR